MRAPLRAALAVLLAVCPAAAGAHPHQWVDWGVGLALDEGRQPTVQALTLELTWDESFSSLMLMDFPAIPKGTLGPRDLGQLDAVYGLASPQRSVLLTVTLGGRALTARPVLQAARTNGKTVTLVYRVGVGARIEGPSELRVSLYDPSYNTDMGIRAQRGAFWIGVKDPSRYAGAASFEQDLGHPYYGGQVYPEIVVFALRP